MRKQAYALAFLMPFASIGTAHADDYGCKVMLCLANPKGPMAEEQCRPPIQRFITGQNKPKPDPFPTCEEGKPATMQPTIRRFDACPQGLSTLGEGVKAIQLTPTLYKALSATFSPGLVTVGQPLQQPPLETQVKTGIGEGEGLLGQTIENKQCVGKPLGVVQLTLNVEQLPVPVQTFEQIVTIAPATSPRVVDIFVNGQLLQSTRY